MPDPIVVRDPEVCGGVPTIRGTRIMVWIIQQRLENPRERWSDVIRDYPSLSTLTTEEKNQIVMYPSCSRSWPCASVTVRLASGEGAIYVDDQGTDTIEVNPADIPALIVALTEAHAAYERWEAAVREWEAEHA